MLVLLSPAKTMSSNLPSNPMLHGATTAPALLNDASDIVAKLKTWSFEQTRTRLGLSDKLAQTVHAWHADWHPEGTATAGWTFRGDAFKSLDFPSLSPEVILHAQQRLRILHAVYGALRPLDQFMPVRLEMAQRWCHLPDCNSMGAFWKTRLPQEVECVSSNLKSSSHILNLASAEYGEVALHGISPQRVVSCVFLEQRNGQLKAISSFAKTARGAMARHVLMHNITSPEDVEDFSALGYVFSAQESSPNKKVFIRTLTS